jgi:uncharacterized protein YqgV (UPF0045/DUF77 family)
MLFEHEQQLNRIEGKVDQIMAAQDDVNAAVTALQAFLTDISNDVAAIKAELASVGVTVDTTALNTVIAQLPAAQAALDALANPAPPVTSASAVTTTPVAPAAHFGPAS